MWDEKKTNKRVEPPESWFTPGDNTKYTPNIRVTFRIFTLRIVQIFGHKNSQENKYDADLISHVETLIRPVWSFCAKGVHEKQPLLGG